MKITFQNILLVFIILAPKNQKMTLMMYDINLLININELVWIFNTI